MSAEITSKDFEYIWQDRRKRIARVYRLVSAGCVHDSIQRFITIKDTFLLAGHALRGELFRNNIVRGDQAMLFRLVDGELEAAWEDIPEKVKKLV